MKRILLIDDNPIDLMIHEKLARRNWRDVEVVKKPGGKEALQFLAETETPPHLILLDIKMPEMDGFEFIDVLREQRLAQDISIYMLSSSIDPNDIQMARENALVKGFLEKPLSLVQLKKCQLA